MLNLVSVLENSAREYPNEIALVFGEKTFTYAQLNGAANQIANGLVHAGIKRGDRVALTCPNLPYFPMAYYGILKAGAAVVPLNVLLKGREIAYHLQDSQASGYLCFEGTPELAMGEWGWDAFNEVETCSNFWMITADPTQPAKVEGARTLGMLMKDQAPSFNSESTSSADTAVVLYTSGTTGQPKGAELTHSNMIMNAVASKDLMTLEQSDTHLLTLPLFHSFGQTVQMNAGLMAGNKLVLMARFEPEAALGLLQNEKVNIFAGVPTMYWAMLNVKDLDNKFDIPTITSHLKLGVSGGASMPVEIIKQFEAKFNVPIIEGYGLSETSPVATFNFQHKERKPGSIGTPIWGVEVKVVDQDDNDLKPGEIGELIIKGNNIMKGYFNQPDQTRAAMRNGWFHTGDMAKMDEEGYFYIVDRLKDMIVRGGFNVYPREIEEVLLTHPAVSMAAVIGIPSEEHGEEIKAFLILKDGASAAEQEIIEWSKEQMAAYKYPREVEIRDALPMTATGKILKRELKV